MAFTLLKNGKKHSKNFLVCRKLSALLRLWPWDIQTSLSPDAIHTTSAKFIKIHGDPYPPPAGLPSPADASRVGRIFYRWQRLENTHMRQHMQRKRVKKPEETTPGKWRASGETRHPVYAKKLRVPDTEPGEEL